MGSWKKIICERNYSPTVRPGNRISNPGISEVFLFVAWSTMVLKPT